MYFNYTLKKIVQHFSTWIFQLAKAAITLLGRKMRKAPWEHKKNL